MAVSHILVVLCFLFTFSSVGAIQCHQCSYQNVTTVGLPGEPENSIVEMINGTQGCEDPFQSRPTGIEMVDCSGQCYAHFNRITLYGIYYGSKFIRGCTTDDPEIDCDTDLGCEKNDQSHDCIYCCNDENGCNDRDVQAGVQEHEDGHEEVTTAENVVTTAENVFKCYECTATLDSGRVFSAVDPYSIYNMCGLSQSLGYSATPPCPSEMCMTLVTPVSKDGTSNITRTCVNNTETLIRICQNEEFLEKQNYEIDCCNSSLCNAGREPPRQIECWTCEANLTKDGFPKDNSSCSRDDFDGTGATLTRCYSYTRTRPHDLNLAGYCTSLWTPSNGGRRRTTVKRGCAVVPFVDACHDQSGYWHGFGLTFKVDCCTEDGCNTGGPVGGRGVFEPDPPTEPAQQPTQQPQATPDGINNGTGSAQILSGLLLFSVGVIFLSGVLCK